MSERSSFVSEFIYCEQCHAALREVLVRELGGEWVAPVWPFRIVAGFVGASWSGGDAEVFEIEIRDEIEEAICHPLRIVVVQDGDGHALLEFVARKKAEAAK